MTIPLIYALLSVGAISLISLVGVVTLSWNEKFLKASVFVLVSLAVGALLGDVFVHLLPEAYASSTNPLLVSLGVLAGILVFFVLEKTLHWHHHSHDDHENTPHPVGRLVLVSDGVHNFIDGLIIGAAYLISLPVGIATTIAVILHEIPQEIGDFGVLIHAGYSKMRALWLNFASALLSVAGALLAFFIGETSELFATLLLPIAAGGFIYIAMADLIPELHKTKRVQQSILQFVAILLGIVAMVVLLNFEAPGHEHAHIDDEHPEVHIHEADHDHE